MKYLLACLALVATATLRAEESPSAYTKLLHATAWVRAGSQGVGTGWVVDAKRRLLITNLHVVGEQDRVEAFFVDGGHTERDYYLEHQAALHGCGRAVRGKVIAREPKSDLALIELATLPEGIDALPLSAVSASSGTSIRMVGHRQDAETLWNYSEGSIRQTGKLSDGYFWRGRKLAVDARCAIAQLPILPGDSGAPIVDSAGEVVGVLAGLRSAPSSAIVIDVLEVRQLLAMADKPARAKSLEPAAAMLAATAWVRPTATEGRAAGFVIDQKRRLLLTTITASGTQRFVDVIFPRQQKGEPVVQANEYEDAIGLRQDGQLVRGWVLARDPARDLALVELESLPDTVRAISLVENEPVPGDAVHAMSHSGGVELLWLYARGSVRQKASIPLVTLPKDETRKAATLLLQLPHQSGSSGGPVVNGAGEAVGMLTVKEAAQQQLAYAVAASALREFTESARPLYEPKSAGDYLRRSRLLNEPYSTLKRAHELFPKDVPILKELVLLHFETNLGQKMMTFANRLAELEPSALDYRALALATADDPGECKTLCARLLKDNPKQPRVLLAAASIAPYVEAIGLYQRAVDLDPRLTQIYVKRAWLHLGMEDHKAGLADCTKAIELDPENLSAFHCRQNFYREVGKHKLAIADGERAVELAPRSGYQLATLAETYLLDGREEKAIAGFVAAMRWDRGFSIIAIHWIGKHGGSLRTNDPDNPQRRIDWYEKSLTAIAKVAAPEQAATIRKALDSRPKDASAKAWAEELDRKLTEWAK